MSKKYKSLADMSEETGKNLSDVEAAYRRGCHQTLAIINRLTANMDDAKKIKSFLGRLENQLREMRFSNKQHLLLLDEAIDKINPKL